MELRDEMVDLSSWAHMLTAATMNITTNTSNETSSAEDQKLPYYTYIYVIVTLFYVIVFAVGVCGNALVIYVIVTNPDMRTATNVFLGNLSVADLLVLLVCMPPALVELHSRDIWYLGDTLCRLVPYLEHVTTHTSVLTILCIGFERYYAICSPLLTLYRCTKARAIRIIGCVWLVACLSAVPFLLMTRTLFTEYHDGGMVPVCRTELDTKWKHVYAIATIILFFTVPLAILAAVYAIVTRKLTQRNHILDLPATQKQVVYMLIAVLAFFVICLLPIKVVFLWYIFVDESTLEALGLEAYLNLTYACRIMFYINSAINPILYNFMSTRFHHAFSRTMGRALPEQHSLHGGGSEDHTTVMGKGGVGRGKGVKIKRVRVHYHQATTTCLFTSDNNKPFEQHRRSPIA